MDQPPRLPLEHLLCFTLYRTSMTVNRLYKPLLDALGLTYPQYLMLAVLGETDGPTIGGIAARLALEPSTVTPAVKRMEAAGFVTRQRDAADERQVRVRLTPAGQAALDRSGCLSQALLEGGGMDGAALQALNQQLQALDAALVARMRAEQGR